MVTVSDNKVYDDRVDDHDNKTYVEKEVCPSKLTDVLKSISGNKAQW